MLFLDRLELSLVGQGISDQVGQLLSVSEWGDAEHKTETCGSSPSESAREEWGRTYTANERLDECSWWSQTESGTGNAEECRQVDGVDTTHGGELLLE